MTFEYECVVLIFEVPKYNIFIDRATHQVIFIFSLEPRQSCYGTFVTLKRSD